MQPRPFCERVGGTGTRWVLAIAAIGLMMDWRSRGEAADVERASRNLELRSTRVRLGDPPVWPSDPLNARSERVGRALVPDGFSVAVSDREQVRIFFNTVYAASEGVEIGWTGFFSTGDPGTTAFEYREAVRRRINYFRAMAGIPAEIRFSEVLNRKCQQSALMMSANNELSHTPPRNWIFWTEEGAEAAGHSNLALGSAGPDAIVGLVRDNGGNNSAVGHRRWFLYPESHTMGTGDVPRTDDHPPANVTWVHPDPDQASSVATVRDGFVAWPPPGFVPYQVIYPRWSFSVRDAAFSGATVTMTRSGTNIPVRLEQVQDGFGDNSLVWIADNQSTDSFLSSSWPRPIAEAPIKVVVDRVRVGGAVRRFEYSVTPIDPAVRTESAPVVRISGPGEIAPGQSGRFQFQFDPLASGYERRSGKISPAPVEGAENGLADFETRTDPGYAVIEPGSRRSGSAGFHLTMLTFQSQLLTWKKEFLILPGARLRFHSRLGFASTDQVAQVGISTDGGSSWNVLYNQPGSDSPGERSFIQREIDLAAYAGQVVKFQFSIAFREGDAFLDGDVDVGWSIDDIQVVQGMLVSETRTSVLPAGNLFDEAFPTLGEQMLQVRGVYFGGYPGEWGPFHRVMVRGSVRPEIRSIVRSTDGRVRIAVSGPSNGVVVILQRSEDLLNWIEASRQTVAGGETELSDLGTGSARQRFYRVQIP